MPLALHPAKDSKKNKKAENSDNNKMRQKNIIIQCFQGIWDAGLKKADWTMQKTVL